MNFNQTFVALFCSLLIIQCFEENTTPNQKSVTEDLTLEEIKYLLDQDHFWYEIIDIVEEVNTGFLKQVEKRTDYALYQKRFETLTYQQLFDFLEIIKDPEWNIEFISEWENRYHTIKDSLVDSYREQNLNNLKHYKSILLTNNPSHFFEVKLVSNKTYGYSWK